MAGNDFLEDMRGVDPSWSCPVEFTSVSFSEKNIGKHDPQRLVSDARLVAAILVLDPECISMPGCEKWIQTCIRAVARREDFRLFVHPQNMTWDDLKHAKETNRALGNLWDTVQVPKEDMPDVAAIRDHQEDMPDVAAIRDHLTHYLTELADIRNATAWGHLSRRIAIILGWGSGVVQAFAAGIAAVMIAVEMGGGRERFTDLLTSWYMPLAVIAGLPVSAALVVMAFQFTHPYVPGSIAKSLLALLFATLPLLIYFEWHTPLEWIMLGITAGILLDVFRRRGYQASLAQIAIDGSTSTASEQALPMVIKEALAGHSPDPLRYPILPQEGPRVFVSYARESPWGKEVAHSLFSSLHEAGIRNSFLDEKSIQLGSCWRKTLNRKLGDANVFINIADKLSVTHGWPAAELESALRRRHLSGLPEIIVLVDPQLAAYQDVAPQAFAGTLRLLRDKPRKVPVLAAFAGILRLLPEAPGPDKPRAIVVKEGTLETVVQGLRFGRYRSQAALPEELGVLVWLVASKLGLVMAYVGTAGLQIGVLAAGLAVLQIVGKLDTTDWLMSHGFLGPAIMLCGFWLGYLARLVIFARFELRHADTRLIFTQHVISAAGLCTLAVLWLPYAPTLAVAWSILLAFIAWLAASSFMFYLGTQKPKLIRPMIGE